MKEDHLDNSRGIIDRIKNSLFYKSMNTCLANSLTIRQCIRKHVLCAWKTSKLESIRFEWLFVVTTSTMIAFNNGWKNNRIAHSVDKNLRLKKLKNSRKTQYNINRYKLFKSDHKHSNSVSNLLRRIRTHSRV